MCNILKTRTLNFNLLSHRFCERLRQHTNLQPDFTELFFFLSLGYGSLRNKQYEISSKMWDWNMEAGSRKAVLATFLVTHSKFRTFRFGVNCWFGFDELGRLFII